MRQATPEDIPRLVEMGRKFHAASNQKCGYSGEDIAAMLGNMIASPSACILTTDGGVIGGAISPAYCDRSWKIAIELFWWAEDKTGLKLLAGFEEWAWAQGANEIRMTTLTNLPTAERILDRRGYVASEISYQKVKQWH